MTDIPPRVVTFNALAGMVLLKLFENHPLPIDLTASDFCPVGTQHPLHAITDGASDTEIFEHTVSWLAAEHYLRFAKAPFMGMHDPTFPRTTLTEKGMGTLTRPLSALGQQGGKQTLGEQLVGAAKSLATKGAGALVTEASKIEFAHIFSQVFR